MIWGAGLALLSGCGPTLHQEAAAPPPVRDTVVFQVRDQAFNPIPQARLEILVDAGEPLTPIPLVSGPDGRAILSIRPSTRLAAIKTKDRLVSYRSVIRYEVRAEGMLPQRGRVEFNDALEIFSRPAFSQMMDRRPKDKTRALPVTLFQIEGLFAPKALEDPLARTVAAELPRLWLNWLASGRGESLRPTQGGWAVSRRPRGAYLKAGLELTEPILASDHLAVHRLFVDRYLPLLADLAAAYAPLVDGWDLTLRVSLGNPNDPHALLEPMNLRFVFSEAKRRKWLFSPGGLNHLILSAEVCDLNDRPWRPLDDLDETEARQAFLNACLSPFFAPGPGELPSPPWLNRTSAEPGPEGPAQSSPGSPGPAPEANPRPRPE